MRVESILQEKGSRVVTVTPEMSMQIVIGRMSFERIGAVVVSRDGQMPDGILSERDVVRGLVEHGSGLLEFRAGDLMVPATTCSRKDTVREVMAKMTRGRIRHLPVVEKGRLLGIVSIGDAVRESTEGSGTRSECAAGCLYGKALEVVSDREICRPIGRHE